MFWWINVIKTSINSAKREIHARRAIRQPTTMTSRHMSARSRQRHQQRQHRGKRKSTFSIFFSHFVWLESSLKATFRDDDDDKPRPTMSTLTYRTNERTSVTRRNATAVKKSKEKERKNEMKNNRKSKQKLRFERRKNKWRKNYRKVTAFSISNSSHFVKCHACKIHWRCVNSSILFAVVSFLCSPWLKCNVFVDRVNVKRFNELQTRNICTAHRHTHAHECECCVECVNAWSFFSAMPCRRLSLRIYPKFMRTSYLFAVSVFRIANGWATSVERCEFM